ncbi:hypothetical protein [[Pseudomonas] carboxydohydrogena]|uniref:hypothetical protein n=1 Tax=Afipia carboxydohydrogena TaxID=290 RepID=UPI0031F12771
MPFVNAKSPDVPGEVDIAMLRPNVSTFRERRPSLRGAKATKQSSSFYVPLL